ncbi:MAG: hypothetical protein HHJ12_00005 [Glaciimonas sp.]|nr:hypothetical protein [Glaciimonas sp.]
MTVKNRLITSVISLSATALLMTACQPKPPALTEKEIQYMQTLTKKMTPRCVGRYLADVPEDMVLNSEGGQEIEGVTIDIKPMTQYTFKLMLAGRKLEIESETTYAEPKVPTLKNIRNIDGATGFIFDRAVSPGSNVLRVLELLAWRDGYFIKMTIRARDMSFLKEENRLSDEIRDTTAPEKLAQLLNVFNRTRGRADNDIPAAQGTCILNGFISGPPTDQEEITLFYHLKTAEDVYFRFSTSSDHARNDTLLDRSKHIEPLIAEGEGKTLRKGHREVHDIKGTEYLYTILGDESLATNKVMTYKFLFEGNNKIGSAKTPLVTIDFANGDRKPMPERPYDADFPPPITKATLSEAEAVTLWDAVIPTIRPRPGAF